MEPSSQIYDYPVMPSVTDETLRGWERTTWGVHESCVLLASEPGKFLPRPFSRTLLLRYIFLAVYFSR